MGNTFKSFRNKVLPHWRSILTVTIPLILLPIPLLGQNQSSLCGYVILIMALYWMTEAIPLPVTSLIPVVLFPLFGIMDTGKVCTSYMKEANMMFLGGLILALAIEYCNLHQRIALKVLLLVGTSPRRLMAGFMTVSAFLSMWISNTASTAMILPIVESVVQQLFNKKEPNPNDHTLKISASSIISNSQNPLVSESVIVDGSSASTNELTRSSNDEEKENKKRIENIRVGMMLSVAYSSSIGGTASLIGSPPQLALKGILNEQFGSATGLNFATFMAFNLPGAILNLFLAWLWLQFMFIGFSKRNNVEGNQKEVKRLLRKNYQDLGSMTFHEWAVLTLFLICVGLWFFRDPQFITGWSNLYTKIRVDDATAVMAIVVLLFVIPADPSGFLSSNKMGLRGNNRALLDWNFVQKRLPWGIILLLGGGFALSEASMKSGLSSWLGQQLAGLKSLPLFAIMFVVCILTATITEVASNAAIANILLPILAETTISIKVNPIYLMLPVTVTCSYAFMLPVATAPNAIVFGAARMKSIQMIKAGFLMNIIGVAIICLMTQTLGVYMFDLYTFPEWASKSNVTLLNRST